MGLLDGYYVDEQVVEVEALQDSVAIQSLLVEVIHMDYVDHTGLHHRKNPLLHSNRFFEHDCSGVFGRVSHIYRWEPRVR